MTFPNEQTKKHKKSTEFLKNCAFIIAALFGIAPKGECKQLCSFKTKTYDTNLIKIILNT